MIDVIAEKGGITPRFVNAQIYYEQATTTLAGNDGPVRQIVERETACAASSTLAPALSPVDAVTPAQALHRQEMILRYAPLVKYVVSRLGVSLLAVLDFDDLLGYGILGLIDAVDRFDPARQVKFETYATSRIRGYIIDQLRALDWMPRSTRQRVREIEHAATAFEQQAGCSARWDDVAASLGLDAGQVKQAQADAHRVVVSLDTAAGAGAESPDTSLLDVLADEDSPGPAMIVEQMDLRIGLSAALHHLPQRERHIIFLYYCEELTLKEISQILGISESRVCQLHARATSRLRAYLEDGLPAQAA